jgi:hypothetical protein
MKYFTPELLLRYGADEPGTYQPATEEWDQACQRYTSYIDSVKGQMTPGLRKIDESYFLHDAKIRAMGKQGRSFLITVQLDNPPHPLVTFTCELMDEPVINTTALPFELRSTGHVIEWQYDELELLAGEPPTWSWSILLSNGWEVKLYLRDVQVQELQAMIPVPQNGQVGAPASTLRSDVKQ